MCYTKVLKTLKFFCAHYYLKVHLCIIVSFNNYILKIYDLLNNALFMFWKMNLKL
jgi:hypothetical protein